MDLRNILTVTVLLALCVSMTLSQKRRKHKKKSRPEPPTWKPKSRPFQSDKYETVDEGKNVTLDCNVKGKPKPKIHWLKNHQKLRSDGTHIKFRKYVLKLNNVTASDNGNYTCVIRNSHGHLNYTFEVNVLHKIWPLEVEGPMNLTVPEGQTVKFRCRVINDPKASIKWIRSDSVTKDNDKNRTPDTIVTSDPELLVIKNVKVSDAGKYTCIAGNIWGFNNYDAWLNVMPIGNSPTVSLKTTKPTTLSPTTERPRRRKTTMSPFFDWTERSHRHTTFIWNPYPTTKSSRGKNHNNSGGRKRRPQKKKSKKPVTPFFGPTTTEHFEYQTIRRLDSERNPDIYDPRLPNEDPRDKKPKSKPIDPRLENTDGKKGKDGKNTKINGLEERNTEGMISLWTIYTIVGAIAGVILLLGLIAITVAVCCRKDSNGVYKSTRV